MARRQQFGRGTTAAMLWEFRSRHSRGFIWHGAAFIFWFLLGHAVWEQMVPIMKSPLTIAAVACFVFFLMHAIGCFCYLESDTRRVRAGIPERFFLLPVSTLRLAAVPMIFGGMTIVAILWLWVMAVFTGMGLSYSFVRYMPWYSMVFLCFLWFLQALSWGTPGLSRDLQSSMILLVCLVLALCGALPLKLNEMSGNWRANLFVYGPYFAFAAAWGGVQWARHGGWGAYGAGKRSEVERHAPVRDVPFKRFKSPFAAQFWLEWRRHGRTLPLFSGVGAVTFILLDAGLRHQAMKPHSTHGFGRPQWSTEGETTAMLALMAFLPLVCSYFATVPSFSMSEANASDERPLFMATRPLIDGDFVLVKLAAMGLSSAVTWALMVSTAAVWLAISGDRPLMIAFWQGLLARGWRAPAIAGLTLMAVPVLLLWRNLAAGLSIRLSGRETLIFACDLIRFIFIAAFAIFAVWGYLHFRDIWASPPWLPWLLASLLAIKIYAGFRGFRACLRRKLLRPETVGWIAAGWLCCGYLIARIAIYWIQGTWWRDEAANFVMFCLLWIPLADLGFAPIALSWNRHR